MRSTEGDIPLNVADQLANLVGRQSNLHGVGARLKFTTGNGIPVSSELWRRRSCCEKSIRSVDYRTHGWILQVGFINFLILSPIMCANSDGVKQDGRRISWDPVVHPISIVPAHVPQHLTSHIRALIQEDLPVK